MTNIVQPLSRGHLFAELGRHRRGTGISHEGSSVTRCLTSRRDVSIALNMTHDYKVPEDAIPTIVTALGTSALVAFEVEALGNDPFVAEASVTVLDDDGVALVVFDLNAAHGPSSFDETVQLAQDTIANLGGTFTLDSETTLNPATATITWS